MHPVSADPEVRGKLSCVSVRPAGAPCPLCAGQSWHGSRTTSQLPAWPWPLHHGDHRPLLSLGVSCSVSNCHLGWGHLLAPSPQHGPLLCGQRGGCVLSSLLSCLSPAVSWSCLATQQGQVGAGGSSPCRITQGTELKCSQAGLRSSSVQVSGTQGTSPNPSCSCKPPASHRAGRAVASWPPAPGEKAHRERRWAGGAGSREAAWLAGEAARLRDCFLLGPDKAASIAPAGKGQCCHLAACLQLSVLHRSLPPVAEHGGARGHEEGLQHAAGLACPSAGP